MSKDNNTLVAETKIVSVKEIKTKQPFEDLLPISEDVLEKIKDDMELNGYDASLPVVVRRESNTLIDGHTRLKASKERGIEYIPVVYKSFPSENDAIKYALNTQCNRRNLKDADILHLVEKLDKRFSRGGDTRSDVAETKVSGRSSEKTAALIGISATKVEKARAVIDADDALQEKVKDGTLSINKAAKKAREAKKTAKEGSKPEDDKQVTKATPKPDLKTPEINTSPDDKHETIDSIDNTDTEYDTDLFSQKMDNASKLLFSAASLLPPQKKELADEIKEEAITVKKLSHK